MLIILLFNLLYVVLLLVFAGSFRRGRTSVLPEVQQQPNVSVIIPVRNEQAHLRTLLASLKAQTYPSHLTEWIFVNDHSTDATDQLLREETDGRMRQLHLDQPSAGKKAALTAGIQQATGKWIITTDADCAHQPEWIASLVTKAETTAAAMVCGFVQIADNPSPVIRFQAMETAVLQVSGGGSLRLGHALLNTGTSLCFLREAWQEINGYHEHNHIASGDDTFLMLRFMQQFPGRVLPLITPAAVVTTRPANSWRDILQQRIRWNGKVRHYPPGSIYMTGIIVFFSGILWLLTGVLVNNPSQALLVFIGVYALRSFAEAVVLRAWKTVAGQSFSPGAILLMSVFYPVFTLFSLIIRPFMKTEWKGRKV